MIFNLKTYLIIFFTIFLFSGCASENIKKVKLLPESKSKFSEELSKEYLKLAEFELNEMHDDWDAHIFAKKSLAAKMDKNVLPEIVSDWKIDESIIEEVKMQREELLIALNDSKSKKFPKLAAKSQIGFDCWLEQLEEGWQKDHIEQCYKIMVSSLSSLKKNILVSSNTSTNHNVSEIDKTKYITPARIIVNKDREQNKVISQKIKVYFFHNKFSLNVEALQILNKMINTTMTNYTRVLIEGHTDRSGTEKYNLVLAKKRAKAVKNYLIKKGINEQYIITKVFGESKPLINTKDGIKEPKNRRVQIEISYDQNLLSRL